MAPESHGGQHAQRVLTEEELLRDVWGFKLMGTSHTARRGQAEW
jgi:DNA-binding response OmpR family regulator